MYKSVNNRGFTLVELLVVVTIIAILSTIGLVMYNSAQKQARMAKRIQDLKAIQTALELYHSVNKTYPITGDGIKNTECGNWNGGSKTPENVIPGLVPTYMPAFPADPQMDTSTGNSCYIYQSNDGTDYKIMDRTPADLEGNRSDPNGYLSQRNLVDPARDGGTNCNIVDGTAPLSWAIWSSPAAACY